jgi:hypothetical protein
LASKHRALQTARLPPFALGEPPWQRQAVNASNASRAVNGSASGSDLSIIGFAGLGWRFAAERGR